MHTVDALRDGALAVAIDGHASSARDLFPGFDASDRIGVVVRTPHGALGASLLYLSAVQAFYELQRQGSDDFWIYPDFFLFHVGRRAGDHASLDVWPDHKEVEVEPDPDRLLEAINDRGITWLATPDDPGDRPPLGAEALASYRSRVRGAFAYSATGRVSDADVVIAGDETTESWVRDTLGNDSERPVARAREALIDSGRPTESYRRIAIEEALFRLCA